MALLLGSLIGSYINIPIMELPERDLQSGVEPSHDLRHHRIRRDRHRLRTDAMAGTVIAVNVGGAVIPVLLSLYLLFKNRMWWNGLIATAVITAIVHMLAYPVPGVGITVPVFVPPIATALVAVRSAWRRGIAISAATSGAASPARRGPGASSARMRPP